MKESHPTTVKTATSHNHEAEQSPTEQRAKGQWVDAAIEALLLITISFTPLLFTPLTSELFEFPKMVFVYLMAVIGLGLIGAKNYYDSTLPFFRTPLNRPLFFYVFTFIISTILSLDLYTSIFGYYTRFNGGLTSLVAYLILFYLTLICLTEPGAKRQASSISRQSTVDSRHSPPFHPSATDESPHLSSDRKHLRLLWAWLISSAIVSIWGILEHFGIDPSCYVLRGTWEANCWVQDVQARVFATFGQPNWLAAYLVATIPVGLALLANTRNRLIETTITSIIILNYAAFWYSYSRSGWIGLTLSLIILLPFLLKGRLKTFTPWLGIILMACLVISISSFSPASHRTATSLEAGGLDTSTGQIRFLVWEGSFKTALRYPLFGSGPETFAYSFLPNRPAGLNDTTEWNFLYNKAHNDVLQTAVTTGVIGLLSWLALYASIGILLYRQGRIRLPLRPLSSEQALSLGIAAGLAGAFTSQLLGFSVVMTSLLFWLGAAMMLAPHASRLHLQNTSNFQRQYIGMSIGAVTIVSLLFLLTYVSAEFLATQGGKTFSRDIWRSTGLYQTATTLNPFEPNYQHHLALNHAYLAQFTEGSARQSHLQDSLIHAQKAERLNPYNMLTLKSLIFTYQQLAKVDTAFTSEAIRIAESAAQLDPNDTVIQQSLADIYINTNQPQKAQTAADGLVKLRPQAATSYIIRGKYHLLIHKPELAKRDFLQAQKLDPSNPEIETELSKL